MNGVEIAALYDSIDDIREHPANGRYRFRALNRWVDGTRTRTTVNGFITADVGRHTRTRPFVLDSDLPGILLGSDRGMDPLELLLAALASCLTTTLVCHASILGVHLDAVEVRVEGDVDLAGCLGIDKGAPTGYREIRLTAALEADESKAVLDRLLATATRSSPVFNTVRHGVPIKVDRDLAVNPQRDR